MSSTFFPLIELFNRGFPRELEVADLTRYFNYNLDIPILVKRHFTHSLDIPITVKRHFTNSLDVAISVKRHFVFSTDFMYEGDDMPTGAVVPFAGLIANIPVGYLFCDGSSLVRATYPNLFTAIGTIYGSVDGDHFSVPDLRNVFMVGAQEDSASVLKTNLTGSLTVSGGAVSHHHDNHAVTQPALSNHGITQPAFSNHIITQPGFSNHGTTTANARTSTASTSAVLTAVAAHSRNVDVALSVHSLSANVSLSAHSLSTNVALDAHDTLSAPQPYYAMAFIIKT